MRLIYIPLCVATLMLCGCNKDTQVLDEKEERNSLVKQAAAADIATPATSGCSDE